jgi:hypothetical protein
MPCSRCRNGGFAAWVEVVCWLKVHEPCHPAARSSDSPADTEDNLSHLALHLGQVIHCCNSVSWQPS